MSVCVTTTGMQMPYVPPPGPPTNLSATAPSSSQVNLTWSAAQPQPGTSIAKYIVYRQDSGNWPPIGTSTTPSFSDTSVSALTSYSYYVIAVDSHGAVSTASNQTTVMTPGALPSVPTGLVVSSVTISTVTLNWSASNGATSYNLYRNGVEVIPGIKSTSVTDTGLNSSTAYTYTVTAVNLAGETAPSSSVVGTTRSASGSSFLFPAGFYVWPGDFHGLTSGLGSAKGLDGLLNLLGTPSNPGIVAASPAWKGVTCLQYAAGFDSGTNAANGSGVSALNQLLTAAHAVGRYVQLSIGCQYFNGSSGGVKPPLNGGGIFPPWWGTVKNPNPLNSFQTQITTCSSSGTNLTWVLDISQTVAYQALLATLQPYAQFDGHPALAMIALFGESISANNPIGMDNAAYWANYLALYAAARQLFPRTLLRAVINYFNSGGNAATSDTQWEQMIAAFASIPGIVYGGPDPEVSPYSSGTIVRTAFPVPPATWDRPIGGNEAFRGNSTDGSAAGVHTNQMGRYAWLNEQQFFGVGQGFSFPWVDIRKSMQLMKPSFWSVVQNGISGSNSSNQFNSAIRPDVEANYASIINTVLPTQGGPYTLV